MKWHILMLKTDSRIFMESIWRKQTGKITVKSSVDQSIEDDIHWDVIVVGAGMAGLLIAYYLKEEGKKVLVLEAAEIASGQTERTTAKITSQHDLKYHKLIKKIGIKKAKLYARANEEAINQYERLIEKKRIECQFERCSAYLYTQQDKKVLWDEAQAATFLGIDACFKRESELPFPITGVTEFRNQAQFSPLEFLKQIVPELEIWDRAKVIKIKGNQVIMHDKVVSADKIVVATHYPMRNVPGFYFLRQHQERSYVLALSGCNKIEGMYKGIDKDGISLRQAGDYLLLGGSSHRTGKNKTGGTYKYLEEMAERYYPGCKVEARWSAQDCMPHDGIPFIGKYSIFTPNLYVATGFQKWGMTTSMVAAMILKEELCGRKSPYSAVFRPQRLNVRAGIKDFLMDVGESVMGLTKGIFHMKGPRCPHMGCELVWNPDEHSWDCPCHGSRFEEDGRLRDNPAKKCIQKEI